MYKKNKMESTSIERVGTTQGEHLETKVKRMFEGKETPKDGAPLTYTARSEGVGAAFNMRSDRFDIAIQVTDYISRSNTAARDKIIADKRLAERKDALENPETGDSSGTSKVTE